MKNSAKMCFVACAMIAFFLPRNATALHYRVTPLVSDLASEAAQTDPNLINSWGLFFSQDGNFWVADNGSSKASVYTLKGSPLTLVVNTSPNPTGAKFNSSPYLFEIAAGKAAQYLFSTEGGLIEGFNQSVSADSTVVAVDNSASGAVYKSLEISGACCNNHFLLATDFYNAKVDIFDVHFQKVGLIRNSNSLPSGYAPFNIKKINNLLYITFAKQKGPDNLVDEPGPGNGFVDVFTLAGVFLKHLVSQGDLNSPWGLALAPSNFGEFSNALLVGNAGDGKINAYDPSTGEFLGQLTDQNNNPIAIDGLRALEFNTRGALYFTSGPHGQSDGLVGTISPL